MSDSIRNPSRQTLNYGYNVCQGSTHFMNKPIERNKVFISSVMNTSVEDMMADRRTVYEVVNDYDFLVPWAFERAPASSEDLEDSYLRPVEEADVFILVVGAQVTEAVVAECVRAKVRGKRILIFAKRVERQSATTEMLLKQLGKKYATFTSTGELKQQVKAAIDQMASLGLRAPMKKADPPSILDQISEFVGKGVRFRVSPIVPRTLSGDTFRIEAANPQTITLYKFGPQETVTIPTSRVKEILHMEDESSNILVLDGRLQHVSTKWRWIFFEDKPDSNLELGCVKNVSVNDDNVKVLIGKLQNRFDFYWGAVDEISSYLHKQYFVFYGDDGRCFYIKDRIRDTVLIAKLKERSPLSSL